MQISANGAAFAPLRTDNGPLALAAWTEPISSRIVDDRVQAVDRARTRACAPARYAKTLTFTLSTTNP